MKGAFGSIDPRKWKTYLGMFAGFVFSSVLMASSVVSAAPGDISAAALGPQKCTEHRLSVRLSDPGEATETIWGQLCYRGAAPSKTVQLLVPGATLDHHYFDFPYDPDQNSYVQDANKAGYTTFNIDRVGTGNSSHPASDRLNARSEAVSVHDVVTALRAGQVGGTAFERVLYIGHSFGAAVGWFEASRYRDVDGLAVTGEMHAINHPFFNTIQVYGANDDPKFAGQGLDGGYLTTPPGTRSWLYNDRRAEPQVAATEESLKQTATIGEFDVPLLDRPVPETAPSQGVKVPTLVLIGNRDQIWCGNDGLNCDSPQAVRQFEAQYYRNAPKLQVTVLDNLGHCMPLHRNGQHHNDAVINWSQSVAKP